MRYFNIGDAWLFAGIIFFLELLGIFMAVSASPSLLYFGSQNSSGSYEPGDILEINATYDEALLSGSYISILLNNSVSLKLDTLINEINPHYEGRISDGSGGAVLENPHSIKVRGDYAYIAVFNSDALEIVDVSNPENPVHKGSYIDKSKIECAADVFISGNYAYIVSSSNKSLAIIDISDPEKPVYTGSLFDGDNGALLKIPSSVYVSGNYAYVTSSSSNALEIVNVSNPSAPFHAANLSNGESSAMLSLPKSVFVSGNYAYIASSKSNALEIVDIHNPEAPDHVANVTHGISGILDYPVSVFVSDNYAYVACSGSSSLDIIDVSNPCDPEPVSNIFFRDLDEASVFISGNYAYLTSYNDDALSIIDISNPSNPIIAGNISNSDHGGARSVFVSGGMAYLVCAKKNTLEIVSTSSSSLSGIYTVNTDEAVTLLNINSIKAQNAVSLDGARTNSSTLLPVINLADSVQIEINDPLNASFTASALTGTVPFHVTFSDSSTGSPACWNWSFGDGEWFNTTDSGFLGPFHTYMDAGTYTVNLTVSGRGSYNSLSRSGYITVFDVPAAAVSGSGGLNTDIGTGFSENLKAGDNLTFVMDKGAVYLVSVTAGTDIQNLMITVKKDNSLPSSIDAPDSEVYEYEDVDLYHIDSSSLSGGAFYFKVKKSWLGAKGYDYNDIVLLHYNEESDDWEKLVTEFSDEDGTYYYYSAEIQSFSWFAIGISEDATIVLESAIVQATRGATAVSTPSSSVIVSSGVVTDNSVASMEAVSCRSLVITLLLVALVIVVLTGLVVRKRKEEYPDWWNKEFK